MANEYLSSRLSMSEFARQKGVSFKMVTYWSARARQLAAESSAPASPSARSGHLIPIGTIDEHNAIIPHPPVPAATTSAPTRSPAAPPSPIEVHLPGGVRVAVGPGFSPEILRSVIACLGRSC